MYIKCLGSGSSGNCYLLETETECLILDCGIPIKKIKKALNYNISKVVGICATHNHLDHSLSVPEFEKMGIQAFKPYESVSPISNMHVDGRQLIELGNFKIAAFHLPHDGVQNRGLLIWHDDLGTMLYMTDMEFCPFTFKNYKVNHMLIEANYSKEYVSEESNHREHVLRGHCEITQTLGIIEANKTDALKTVILCHISAESGSPVEFVEQAQKVAGNGITVDFADAGKQWELTNGDKCPFM